MQNNKKIHPGQIGFDIDGVVADTGGAFVRIARREYGMPTLTLDDITEFEVENCLDMDPRVINAIFARLLSEPRVAGLEPMPHAVEVLTEFAALAPLTFVTARPDAAPITGWLHDMLGKDILAESRIVAMGEHDNKAAYIKNLGLRYFVDDRAETCIRLAQEGIIPLVYSQPWNRGRHELATVDNWLAIRALSLV